METALRYELIKAIPELNNQIYPTNAPEGVLKPYLVYSRISTRKIKTLEGYTNKQALSYMFSVMATKYGDMVRIRKQVEELLLGMAQRIIGKTYEDLIVTKYDELKIMEYKKLADGGYYIEDIDINNVDEQYEHQLGVNRGIIDFTIYY